MIYTQFSNGQNVNVIQCDIKRSQSSIDSFSFSISKQDLILDPESMQLESVSIYNGTSLLISGIIEDVEQKFSARDGTILQFTCLQEIGRLAYKRARGGLYYNDQEMLFALAFLFEKIGGFQLRDITTLSDNTVTITKALINKQNMWSQITEIINSIRSNFFRYAGIDPLTGNYMIDIGSFGDNADANISQGSNLLKLDSNSKLTVPFFKIEAYGGEYSTGSFITLLDALTFDATLATHPDYPIIVDSDGEHVVKNNSITSGNEIVKIYTDVKPSNESPSGADIAAAGWTLWNVVVRDIEESKANREFSATCTFDDNIPLISQDILTMASVYERAYDTVTSQEVIKLVFSLNEFLRIVSINTKFANGKVIYSLKLSRNIHQIKSNSPLQIYDIMRSTSIDTRPTKAAYLPVMDSTSNTVVAHSSTTSDHNFAAGNKGKLFAHTRPAVPADTDSLAYGISISPTHYNYVKINNEPTISQDTLDLVVIPAQGDWDTADNATVTVKWMFWDSVVFGLLEEYFDLDLLLGNYRLRNSSGHTKLSQTFLIPISASVDRISLYMRKNGNPVGNIFVEIEEDTDNNPSGTVIANGTSNNVDASTIDASGYEWIDFDFSTSPNLVSNVKHHMVINGTFTINSSNNIRIRWADGQDNDNYRGTEFRIGTYDPADSPPWTNEREDFFFRVFG